MTSRHVLGRHSGPWEDGAGGKGQATRGRRMGKGFKVSAHL